MGDLDMTLNPERNTAMTEVPELAALACDDCTACWHQRTHQGLAGPVLVVTVEHAPTCPWLGRVAPSGHATTLTPHGIRVDFRAGE